MTLLRVNPVKDFENIHNNIQKYFEDYSDANNFNSNEFLPNVDVRHNDGNIFIDVDVPGVKKEDLKLSVKNNVLTIEGEKKRSEEKEEMNWYRNERSFGSFKRSFGLPKNTDTDNIEANHENGTLSIKLNKIVPKQPEVKEIKVN